MRENAFTKEFNPTANDVAVCGSMSSKKLWLEVIDKLRENGLIVSTPDLTETIDWSLVKEDEIPAKKGRLVRRHLANISVAKAVLVCNYKKHDIEDYIGINTLIEMTVAYTYGIPIYILNEVPNQQGREEILAFEPKVLHGDLSPLIERYKSKDVKIVQVVGVRQ